VAESFNPFDADFIRDPYPTYERLRQEAAVARVRIGVLRIVRLAGAMLSMQRKKNGGPGLGRGLKFIVRRISGRGPGPRPKSDKRPRFGSKLFTVSRFDEVSHVLRHPEIFSSEIMGGSEPEILNDEGDIAPTSGALIAHDPPEHTRQRAIVNRGFTPRRIAALEPRIRKNAEELFASFAGRGDADLMKEFANPLPVMVIAEMLGLDPARRDDFKRWSTALIVGSTRPAGGGYASNFELFREFRAYMTQVIEERRRNPGDDLISNLIHTGEGEGILDPEQVVSFATLMLAAGSETTTNLIGNAMLALFRDPELLARVQAHPELIPQVVEEALRYDAPVQLTARLAVSDSEVAGVAIPKGSIVAVLLGSANRDETHFEHADRFDIDRETPSHLAFGFGNHFCIGASLARLEGRVALEMILTRLPELELTVEPDQVERHGSFLIRGPSTLPVRFSSPSAASNTGAPPE
jgi:cytochrome P450